MRIKTRSHLPASLSEAFAKSAALADPSRSDILNYFTWLSSEAWAYPKARKMEKVDDLIHHWTGIKNHRFNQKQLMNVLKGLSLLYTSDKISDEVKAYFKTEAAFAEWFDQYHNQPHTLYRPFMEECVNAFEDMGIEPAQTFLEDFQNCPMSASAGFQDREIEKFAIR